LKQYVADQTAISRKYRDEGHQFWGRIIGTSADADNAQWLLDKFKHIGLWDIHEQTFDLPPQWMPQHSDHETDDTISASGMAGVTRAYAKIVADTDKIPLKDLQHPPAGNQRFRVRPAAAGR
jgi:hypothetical protein